MSYKKTSVLPNGIVVATEELPDVYSASIGIWVDTGSRDEKKLTNGLAHLFEHMAFKGTHNRTGLEIVRAFESSGGQINAFTTREQTCFYARVVQNEVDLALEVLLDMVFNPLLDTTDLKKEKSIIIEELKGYDDNPEEWVYELFSSALFGDQSIGFPVAGTVKTVRSFNRSQLLSHLKKIQTKLPVYIVASGKVKHREIVKVAKAMTGSFIPEVINGKALRSVPRTVIGRNRVKYYSRHLLKKKPVHQANVIMGAGAYPAGHNNYFPLIVLNSILGDGMSSRLFQRLREDYGWVYHISSYTEGLINAGLIGLTFSTEPKYIEKSLMIINREITQLKEQGITKQELAFAKKNHKGNFLLDMESTQSRMAFLSRITMRGGKINSQAKYLKALEDVTLDQVNAVVRELFNSERWALACVLPENVKLNSRKWLSF